VFFTAIAGSLAGAFAGAYGAQRIAERAKIRDELLKEIRNTNAAIMVTFGICNSLLAIKKQHVKSLKETFEAHKADFLGHQNKLQSGEISKDKIFELSVDLQTLSLQILPVDILHTQVFEKLSLTGRPLVIATTLSQAVHSLSMSLEKRNQLIESYKVVDAAIFPTLYLGLQHGRNVNLEYPSVIDAIYSQTDDGIFFSQLLCKDLVEHGEQVAKKIKKNYRKVATSINKPDFAKVEASGLMPKVENYSDWFTMFSKKADSPTFSERIRAHIKWG
jgi:hypothetical protein